MYKTLLMKFQAFKALKGFCAIKPLLGLCNGSVNHLSVFIGKNFPISSHIFSEARCVPISLCDRNLCISTDIKKNSSHDSLVLLKNNEIWTKSIEENEIHTYREAFEEYIKFLGKLSKDLNVISSLCFPKIGAQQYEQILRSKDKIFELALLLKCSPEEAYRAIVKHHFLFQSRISTLKNKVDVITASGIALSDLRKDLWVLSYTVDKLQGRINKVKTLNLQIKCWMLRCEESVLDRTWKNREDNKAAMLPFTTNIEYLCNRLMMNENQLLSLSRRQPAVLKIKTKKLREILDYLFSEGFTPTQIYNTPRILCHSISTIKNRLYMMRERDLEPRTLSLLCKSRKAFEVYIKKFEKDPPT